MRFCFQFGVARAVLGIVFCAPILAGNSIAAKAVPVARIDPRSGQQVKTIKLATVTIASREMKPQAAAVSDSNMKGYVEEAAQKYDVSPALIDSVIQVESNYNPLAISPKGAEGLMQLMPATARRFGVQNTFDPRDNIHGGVKYLKFLQETFKDDRLAIAAYNAGEGAVSKYNNVPPYPETQNYVEQVGKRYGKAKAAQAKAKAVSEQAKIETPAEPKYAPVRQYVDSGGRIHLTTQ